MALVNDLAKEIFLSRKLNIINKIVLGSGTSCEVKQEIIDNLTNNIEVRVK